MQWRLIKLKWICISPTVGSTPMARCEEEFRKRDNLSPKKRSTSILHISVMQFDIQTDPSAAVVAEVP